MFRHPTSDFFEKILHNHNPDIAVDILNLLYITGGKHGKILAENSFTCKTADETKVEVHISQAIYT
jgi:hypothetical protein